VQYARAVPIVRLLLLLPILLQPLLLLLPMML
jgi:hypothetical protein